MHTTKKNTPSGGQARGVGAIRGLSRQRNDAGLVTAHKICGGQFLLFHASEQWLLNTGLLNQSDLPNSERVNARIRHNDDFMVQAVRLQDGTISLTISAHVARIRDSAFQEFMVKTMDPNALPGSAIIKEARP